MNTRALIALVVINIGAETRRAVTDGVPLAREDGAHHDADPAVAYPEPERVPDEET